MLFLYKNVFALITQIKRYSSIATTSNGNSVCYIVNTRKVAIGIVMLFWFFNIVTYISLMPKRKCMFFLIGSTYFRITLTMSFIYCNTLIIKPISLYGVSKISDIKIYDSFVIQIPFAEILFQYSKCHFERCGIEMFVTIQ